MSNVTSTNATLFWVHRNRSRWDKTRSIGEVLQKTITAWMTSLPDELARIDSTFRTCTDTVFQQHCRISGVKGDTVIIGVDAPTLISDMRRRWTETLQRALRQSVVGRKWKKVRFQHLELDLTERMRGQG